MAATKKPVYTTPLAMLATGAAVDICHQKPGTINNMKSMRNFGEAVALIIHEAGLRVDAARLMRGDHGEQAAVRAFSRCLSMAAEQPATFRNFSRPLFNALSRLHPHMDRSESVMQALALEHSQWLDAAAKRELSHEASVEAKMFCLRMSSALG